MLIGVIAEELLLPQGVTAVVIDSDIFPSASIFIPGYLLLEGQFDEGDAIYAPFITNASPYGIFPQLFVDPDVIYAASRGTIVPVLAPSHVVATDLFFSPTVLSNVLGPLRVIDVDLFGGTRKITEGKASINQSTTVDPVFDVDNIFRPVIEQAGRTLIPQQAAFSADAEVVHLNETTRSTIPLLGSFVTETAALTAPPLGFLLSPLVVAGDAFFTPDLRRPIAPGIFTDVDVIYAAFRFDRLLPGRLLDSDSVSPGSFGGPTVLPSIVADADAFFASAIASILPPLLASLVSDGDIFFAPLASLGETLDTVIDTDVVLAPTVIPGDATAAPLLVGADDAVSAPAINVVVTLAAGLVTDSDTFFVPDENSIGQPSAFTDTDTFYVPTITQMGFDGVLALDGQIMPATPQPTVIYIEG